MTLQRQGPELWVAWFDSYPQYKVEDISKSWVIYRLVTTYGSLVGMDIKEII